MIYSYYRTRLPIRHLSTGDLLLFSFTASKKSSMQIFKNYQNIFGADHYRQVTWPGLAVWFILVLLGTVDEFMKSLYHRATDVKLGRSKQESQGRILFDIRIITGAVITLR